jgi:hypothetical protein
MELTRAAGSDLRHTGIRLLKDMPWGSHICVFYDTKADLPTLRLRISRPDLKAMSFASGRFRSRSAMTTLGVRSAPADAISTPE